MQKHGEYRPDLRPTRGHFLSPGDSGNGYAEAENFDTPLEREIQPFKAANGGQFRR
jgi:hypothetical protein